MIGAIEMGARVDDATPYTKIATNSALAIDEAYTVNTKRKQYLYSR